MDITQAFSLESKIMTKLILVADTNLFFECVSLDTLPWEELNSHEVQIVITRPVQKEIDKHKKKSGRTRRRAVKYAGIIRNLVEEYAAVHVIREFGPRVSLKLQAMLRPDDSLADQLDYNENDDQIVGCAFALRADNLGEDIRLLTHDTGPMASAKAIGVPFLRIPDTWIAGSIEDPRIGELQAENTRLRNNEPKIEIKCPELSGSRIQIDQTNYTALSDDEIEVLLESLKSQYPMQLEFARDANVERLNNPVMAAMKFSRRSTPPTQEAIDDYQNTEYPEWLSACRKIFQELHVLKNAREPKPEVTFSVENVGTRPAEDALLRFEADGNVWLSQQTDEEDTDDNEDKVSQLSESDEIKLPKPPSAPAGEWGVLLGETVFDTNFMRGIIAHGPNNFDLHGLLSLPISDFSSPPRHPDKFYWRNGPPQLPTQCAELDCMNWRQGDGPQEFVFELSFKGHNGIIKLIVFANNLTDPVQINVPFNVTINDVGVLDIANELIRDL